jgi:hypothetical protein
MLPRPVDGAPGYLVDPYGGVSGPAGRVLRAAVKYRGYLQVTLCTPTGRVSALVHRLVAAAFRPGVDDEVNHRDLDKTNNVWHNLEWVSSSFNKLHATALGAYPTGPDHYRYAGGHSDRGRVARRSAIKAEYQLKGTT